MNKHTPTPWIIKHWVNIFGQYKTFGTETCIGSFGGPNANDRDCLPENMANAEFAVRACNAHDDLLAACKAARRIIRRMIHADLHHPEDHHDLFTIETAIAKAEGER